MIVAGIQITKDHPPPPGRGDDNPVRAAMKAMPVGTSFFAQVEPAAVHGIAKTLKPKRFRTSRKANGTRVWRTA